MAEGGYIGGQWYDYIWDEKPKDDEFTFASSKTWDSDYYNPYDKDGKLKPGWAYHNTDISRGPYAYFLEKVTDDEGNEFWVADARPGADYRSGTRPRAWQANVVDAIASYLVPAFGVASGISKVAKGGYEGGWGEAAGGAVQAIGSAYGAGWLGDGAAGGADAFAATQASDDAAMTGWTTISPSDYAATAAGEDMSVTGGRTFWDEAGDLAQREAKRYAKNYAKKYVLDAFEGDGEYGGGGGMRPLSAGFNIDDSPLADVFKDKEESLNKVFKMTGETADIETAIQAVRTYETTAVQLALIEQEVQKYSPDPEYKIIEPELRVATMEAIQQGMSPKQATAYAFEKAKKGRALNEFLTEFKMRKKLELAGISGERRGVSL